MSFRVPDAFGSVRRLPDGSYAVDDDRVLSGASLGNAGAWVVCKSTGAIQKIFSLAIGRDVFWSTVVTYGSPRHRVLVGLEPSAFAVQDHLAEEGGHIKLVPLHTGVFEFYPWCQVHRTELPTGIQVTETTFVPRTGYEDPAVAYISVELRNPTSSPEELIVIAYSKLRGTTPPDMTARYDPKIGGLVAHNASNPEWVRIFGCTVPPHGYQTAHHPDAAYDPANIRHLTCTTEATGEILGALSARLVLAPDEAKAFAFVLVFSEKGEAAARDIYRDAIDVPAALERTRRFFSTKLDRSRVLTPEQTINDGALWAKANMLRVIAKYPQGYAFTNDPGNSSAVVGRDLAWFCIGCDYLDSDVSKEMLLRFARTQYPDGMLPEYYNAVTGTTEDYGHNINDDTPLFVLACASHYAITADDDFLDRIWPYLTKACDYILAQRDERGLVVCRASGENAYGICGWRNIIPHYSMNGAVTEINAECFGALAYVGVIARTRAERLPAHRIEFEKQAQRYADGARALKDAINTHLLNPNNGMYVLNIGLDGDVHGDVTGDEVFPVLFEVAPAPVAYRIVRRLNDPDFQTEAGLRTVSRLSPDYTPYRDVGLIGGVWPGLSFWYARAAAKIYPDAMARNLKQSYAQYLRDPKMYNTVPGQFSEWFDGESLVNRGMRLSPWEPPRYLWAAITGACGLVVGEARKVYRVDPLMPSGWTWLGVRSLRLGGRDISYFVVRSRGKFLYFTTGPIEADGSIETYAEDVSDRVNRYESDVEVVALGRGHEVLLCIGSVSAAAHTFPVSLRDLLDSDRRYGVHLFDPALGAWVESEGASGRLLCDIAVRVDAQSYILVRFDGSESASGKETRV
jgi:glycogen debranching enzyme